MNNNKSFKKLWKDSYKALLALSCLLAIAFGWLGNISPARAVSLSDYQTIAQATSSYGRGGEADREAKKTLRTEGGIAKPNYYRSERNANAEKTPQGLSAKTDNSAEANSIHGRERLEVGRIQGSIDDSKGKSQGIIQAITDKLSGNNSSK